MIIQLAASSGTYSYARFVLVFMFYIVRSCYSAKNEQFTNCSRVFSCGNIRGIGYPFWGGDRPSYCGSQGFRLDCFQEDQSTNIFIGGLYYTVLRIDQSIPKMTIVPRSLRNNSCRGAWRHTSSLPSFSITQRLVKTIDIFYGCTPEVMSKVQIPSNITCKRNNGQSGVFFAHPFVPDVEGCEFRLSVLISLTAYSDLWDGKITLGTAIDQGFDVQYNPELTACAACEASGGKCGSNSDYQFICICPGQSYQWICSNHEMKAWQKTLIGATAAGIILSACLITGYCKYTGNLPGPSLPLFKRIPIEDQNLETIIKQYRSLTPRRYSYSDIKKMTNSFSVKLGQGGYGDVYKGYLSDGLPVAVKIIKTTKGNGEEFINEVASISRTSHVNIVNLLGFCIDDRKRALVYEFLLNGSLDKYIHEESDTQLGLDRLYGIAIGTARGLEYLHRGCKTRILHFDIKPHNILLDEDFCPKISDFGLAKLCANKESIVSMLGVRGTIGYIAPEVFSQNFGGVSYKSDVYSYGMMLLEMVGVRKNAVNTGMSNTSETYFPDWIYQRIMSDEDLKLQDHIMSEEENEMARKMIMVGLWCIQTNPSHRPTMSKVIDMLEGSLKDLELPPRPSLSSPSRSDHVSLAAATTVAPSEDTSDSPLYSPSSLADSCTTSTRKHFVSRVLNILINSKKSSKRSRD